MGLLDNIKGEIKKSGASKGKLLYFREDTKVRVRFLTDLEDGMEIPFHDSFQEGVNLPCQEVYGRECKYCEMEGLRTRNMYIWSVWDYEAKEVKLIVAAVNNCSPVPTLVALYETYGTLLDRDFVITRKGSGQNTSYAIVPMDKMKFRNTKAKPFSEQAILKILDKAYPDDEAEEEDEEDMEERPAKKKGTKSKTKKKSEPEEEYEDEEEIEDEDESEDWGDEEEEEIDYSEMSAKALYNLCKERGIKVQSKKSEKFYIRKLEEWDEENGGEEDEDWDE